MNRRDLLWAAAAAAISPVAGAAARRRHVTSLQPLPSCEETDKLIIPALRAALAQQRLAEIEFENHCFGNDFAQAEQIMRDAIRRGTGALIVGGTPTALLAQRVTTNVPVVAILGDPVSAGLTRDVRRPEGNITGFGNSRPETPSKIVDLARSVSPGFKRLVIVGDADYPEMGAMLKPLENAATAAKKPWTTRLVKVSGFDALFASLGPGDVAYVEHALADYAELATIALRHRIPTIGKDRDYVKLGGLLAYNTRTANVSIRQVTMLDKLLKGVPVAHIPWELPDDIYLGVNLKTAQALGLTIPADIRLRATQVIE